MNAANSLLLCSTLLFVSAEQKNITAESGQNITLTCRAPTSNIGAVEWTRDDLGEEYVLFYQDKRFVPDNQHPSFKDRVDLQDRQMKDGDVSLILKNVTTNDTGTYECHVVQRGTSGLKLLSNIDLSVAPPPPGPPGGTTEDEEEEDGGKEDGSVGLIVGLSVAALLLVAAVVGFVIYRKHKQQQSEGSYCPPD